MGAIKKVVKAAAQRSYLAYTAEELTEYPAGHPTPEDAVDADGPSEGEVCVVYELVEVGRFLIENKRVLVPIE